MSKRGKLIAAGSALLISACSVTGYLLLRSDGGPRKVGDTLIDETGAPVLISNAPKGTVRLAGGAVLVGPAGYQAGFEADYPDELVHHKAILTDGPDKPDPADAAKRTATTTELNKPGFAKVGWFKTTKNANSEAVPTDLALRAAHLLLPGGAYEDRPDTLIQDYAGSRLRHQNLWGADGYERAANDFLATLPTDARHLVLSGFVPMTAEQCKDAAGPAGLPFRCAYFTAFLLDASGKRVLWENRTMTATETREGWYIGDSALCRDLKDAYKC